MSTPFRNKLRARWESLLLTLISKKMLVGTFWALVATGLLLYGVINEQTWSMMVVFLIGIIFGVAAVEKIGGVKYEYPRTGE